MQYEIRAYDALYDAKTRRIAYWDVCSAERHKTVETRADAAEDLWPCPPNEKRIERFRELLEYYEMDLEALREARKRRAKI